MPPKVKYYTSARELLAKLEGRAALWARTARENQERSDDFEQAAEAIRNGATSVTVGRTTYELSVDGPHDSAPTT